LTLGTEVLAKRERERYEECLVKVIREVGGEFI
jgi:hypothetical protein